MFHSQKTKQINQKINIYALILAFCLYPFILALSLGFLVGLSFSLCFFTFFFHFHLLFLSSFFDPNTSLLICFPLVYLATSVLIISYKPFLLLSKSPSTSIASIFFSLHLQSHPIYFVCWFLLSLLRTLTLIPPDREIVRERERSRERAKDLFNSISVHANHHSPCFSLFIYLHIITCICSCMFRWR